MLIEYEPNSLAEYLVRNYLGCTSIVHLEWSPRGSKFTFNYFMIFYDLSFAQSELSDLILSVPTFKTFIKPSLSEWYEGNF